MLGPIETYLYIQSKVLVAFASSGVCQYLFMRHRRYATNKENKNQNYFFPTPVLFTEKHKFVLENLYFK